MTTIIVNELRTNVWNMQNQRLNRELVSETYKKGANHRLVNNNCDLGPWQNPKILAIALTIVATVTSSLFPVDAYGKQPKPDQLVPTVRCTKNISLGSTIASDSLKIINIDKRERPADAIYDPWIAIGRKATKSLTKGEVVHFSDALSPDLLVASHRNGILKMQGDYSTRVEDPNRRPSVLIPVLRSAHDIPAGATISAADLVTDKIKEKNCPGDAVGDLWVVVGRKAVHSIKAHQYVIYLDTIPTAEWLQWLNNGWNGSKKCDMPK